MITDARRRELVRLWNERADELEQKAASHEAAGRGGLATIYRRNATESRADAARLEAELERRPA